MYNFKNEVIKGEPASRYIASWLRAGGRLYYERNVNDFNEWLISLGLDHDEAAYITELARCGKFEFQEHAKQFLQNR